MKPTPLLLIASVLSILAVPAGSPAADLVQLVSREHPKFNVAASRLAVGRDGRVYLAGGEYVLRIGRDGRDKLGVQVTYALAGAAANADGILATANAHFNHSVNLWSPAFQKLGAVDAFLVNDQVEWQAPCAVEAGSGGDFFGMDQNRGRIVRVAAPGRLVTTYSVKAAGDFVRKLPQFRVWEPGRRFYVLTDKGTIKVVDFGGKLLWSLDTHVGGNPWDGWRGSFDVDDAGRLHVLEDASDVVKVFGPDGKPAGEVKLQRGQAKGRVSDLRVWEDDLILRRADPVELFQVYDRKTGALRRVVRADVERLRVTFPSEVWTAGQPVALAIDLDAGERKISPRWKVFLRPFNTPGWQELPLRDGRVAAPADAGGLYQLRVGAGLYGSECEYQVQGLIEVRRPDARGSVSVLTPLGRVYYGRGEEVPISVICRAEKGAPLPQLVTLRLVGEGRTVAELKVPVGSGGIARATLPKTLTAALAPGQYRVTAEAPGLTVASQALVIGPGLRRRPAFHIVQHGDYSLSFPTASALDAPEAVARHLERSRKLRVNLFVDRLGSGSGLGQVDGTAEDGPAAARLRQDPRAVAPETSRVENALRQTVAGYGALGMEEQAILLYMDAGLPVGTGFDRRKPEEFTRDITRVSAALKDYPAFRGWSWAANWWIEKRGAAAAPTPARKAAYEAALKKALATGAWDPVLDEVSQIWVNYAVDAERQFNATLQKVAPGKRSVMTGPYRQPGILPPVTFKNADEVDLHYQAEQIQPPQVTPHNVDFYKRPGKPAWGHPELWNDDGTGGMIYATALQMVMRGADGVGWSGSVPAWGPFPSDVRATGQGTVSCFRALNDLLHLYGPWLATLESRDPVAIPVSSRMMRIEAWKGVGGWYFTRLFEAYNACLYAHRPARFIFAEDMTADSLTKFKAVLLVSQTVEPEPALVEALARARKAGVPVFRDDSCRAALVKDSRRLGTAFTKVENDPSVWQDDAAYVRFPAYFKTQAGVLREEMGPDVPPVAEVDSPEVLVTEKADGEARFVWVINNTMLGLDPGQMWRVGLVMSQRRPVVATVKLNARGKHVYDVFARQCVQFGDGDGTVRADLRTVPARLYAILPTNIGGAGTREAGLFARAGRPVRWTARFDDSLGKPVPARLPMRVTLVSRHGEVLDEQVVSAGPKGTPGEFIVPVNLFDPSVPAKERKLYLQARDLVGDLSSETTVDVEDPDPKVLAPWSLPGRQPAAPARPAKVRGALQVDEYTHVNPAPANKLFGLHLRDLAVSADGRTVVVNAMHWGDNLYGLDWETGRVLWQRRIGHHFAYGPEALAGAFAVQGFDFNTAEGYHLYLLGPDGTARRRFALYGLPHRATSWAAGAQLLDRINHFAAAPDGSWVAAAGDLGLAVWDKDGKLLWSQDWWRTTRKRTPLVAQDTETLVVLDGMTAAAYRAADGRRMWQLALVNTGALQEGVVSADRKTLALRADSDGGRIFIVRGGKLVNTLITPADAQALSSDGSRLAVTTGHQLKWYAADAGLEWSFTGDDVLRGPRISADGRRVAVGSELGSLYVLGAGGELEQHRDLGALPAVAWHPEGELLAACWNGKVLRIGPWPHRHHDQVEWRVYLPPGPALAPDQLLAADATPTTRRTAWGNAAARPAPLTPNLLKETRALVTAVCDPPAHGDPRPWQNPVGLLYDGKVEPPPRPWLGWTDINYIDSGWRGKLALQFDTFHTQLQVTGITFVEDADHPESWLRDARLQVWDAAKEQWGDGPYLLSDAATHTHYVEKPLEGAKFRLVSTGGGTWPAGNLRLGEVVFHGRALGASHPDAAARRPVAVLFDEKESDLKALLYPGRPFAFKYDDAYSGGKCLALTAAGNTGPAYVPPFGHAVPNWDFEIVEDPQPGQYRWLQFAWKATSPKTTGMALLLGRAWPGGGYSLVAGKAAWPEGVLAARQVADRPPADWQVVRVDLWELYRKPVRVQALSLLAVGGGAAFDQILLARTAEDLQHAKPVRTLGR
jgi:outer membrane protein assembly factor BamB